MPSNIEAIAAVFRHQAVDQSDVGLQFHQPPGEVRADETEPAGDEHIGTGVGTEIDGDGRAFLIHAQLATNASAPRQQRLDEAHERLHPLSIGMVAERPFLAGFRNPGPLRLML